MSWECVLMSFGPAIGLVAGFVVGALVFSHMLRGPHD
jgi:hypothetical protein